MSILFNRVLPFITAILVFVLAETIFKYPAWFYYLSALLVIMVALATWQTSRFVYKGRVYWQLMVMAVLLAISAISASLFISTPWIRHLLAIGLALLYWSYLSNLLVVRKGFLGIRPLDAENVFFLLGLVSLFFFYSATLALSIYLHVNSWLLFFLVWIISGLIYYEFLWINRIRFFRSLIYTLPVSLILAELFLVFKNFPISFYVNSLVLTSLYFLAADLSRLHLQNSFSNKKLYQRLGLVLAIFLLTWLTARWR